MGLLLILNKIREQIHLAYTYNAYEAMNNVYNLSASCLNAS